MAVAGSSIGWLQAFALLPLLALNTMVQPVGRVLGSSAFNSVWLRASPILCTLDAMSFAFRFLAYGALLRATPREAICIIGIDRFDEAKPDYGVRKIRIIATASRLFGFSLGILLLTYVVRASEDIRWTVAWAWMYAAPYVVLEIATQLATRELSKPQYTPADFELDEVAEEPDDDEISHANTTEETADVANDRARLLKDETQAKPAGSASTKYKRGRTSSEIGSMHDEDDGSLVDLEDFTAALASTKYPYLLYPYLRGEAMEGDQRIKDDGDSSTSAESESSRKVNRARRIEDHIDGSTLSQVETTESTNGSGPSDLEAAKNSNSKHTDPTTSPWFPTLKHAFARMDRILFRWGCLLHVLFLYWAFLDLVQPPLNRHILSSSSWEIPLYILSLPFIFACLFLAMLGSLGAGCGIFTLFLAMATFVNQYLPTSIEKFASGVPILFFCVLGGIGMVVGYFGGSYVLGKLLLSDYMAWVYELISVEIVVLFIFFSICFSLYILLKFAAEASTDVKEKLGLSGYLGEDGVALLTSVLVTFTVSILWYRFRYASSAHWVQDWRDALVVNTTMTNTTMINTTMTSKTMTN